MWSRLQSPGHFPRLICLLLHGLLLMYCLCTGFISAQDGNITCTVPPVEEFQNATLTCHFPEDLNTTKKDFSVFHKPTHPGSEARIECWWLSGKLQCSAKSGIKYQTTVSRSFNITILNVTPAVTGPYSCQLDNYDANLFQTCNLEMKKKLDTTQDVDHSVTALATGLSVGLFFMAVGAATLILLRRKKTVLFKWRQRQSNLEEAQNLLMDIVERDPVTKRFQEHLVKEVSEMYPDLSESSYFVPPVYFNRTRYRQQTVAGQLVYVRDLSDPSDVGHDRAMQHVIQCLRHMAESQEERMFVLTQFQYEDYLNSPDPAYRHHRLPTSAGLREADSDVGCFDFLIVHRLHGLLVGVVKAVSDREVESQNNGLNIGHVIVQEVKEALKYLKKAKRVIQHLISDQQNVPNVRQTLIFPNLSRSSLEDAVRKHDTLVEDLLECLGTNTVDDLTELCLCAEQLSESNAQWDVSLAVVSNMRVCWKWNVTHAEGSIMTDELYLTMIARFCGPATQSSLRVPQDYEHFSLPKTVPEGVSLTGDLFARLVLSLDLIELLDEPRVVLSGPPHSGKTTLLSLAGGKWLSSGHDVFVIKNKSSKNASVILQHLKALKAKHDTESASVLPFGSIYEDEWSFDSRQSIEKWIERILEKKTENILCVDIDETDHYRKDAKEFKTFCESLKMVCPDLHLWATCSASTDIPGGWRVRNFTQILNCPPEVIKEVLPAAESEKLDCLPPTEGQLVKHIRHKRDGLILYHDCAECGKEVAGLVRNFITANIQKVPSDDAAIGTNTSVMTLERPAMLQVKDLLIVLECDMKQGERFLTGLRESGIAVHTFTSREDEDGTAQEDGSASAVHVDALYRYRPRKKVVVYVESKAGPKDLSAKSRGITCCTSQLIVVRRN